ncbi:MAG TPA: UDP-N-acetylmuramoylalanyl-D-glutamyl-2,6-diaminopimelate--D-alanyl-D-alanine ligase [Stellaceae bacterium]|jgi:UDP-N-acetylmuramoyl-tripeptide--D-alanyl-D-alanine ligase|nr:UDP-N-acetylmuramoylalanyl-D-glutamyl-2,6-diaminopimelate--D-alanyl-D-alanine ligase [Stellaceae bacterium]
MTALWTAQDAAAATGGTTAGAWQASGVSIDSRTVAAADLFVALSGPKFDGHDFVAAAFARGAAAAVVAKQPPKLGPDPRLLLVGDTQAALETLGRAGRARAQGRIVAITGSVGKTGTKEALKTALARQGRAFASSGSLNNHWGVPLSLSRLPPDADYGVFELGMNHPGEIDGLTRMVRPHVAVITTIEPAHLGFFPSVEAIADAKAEIFAGVERNGAAVLNRDNPHFARLAKAAQDSGITRIIGFGEHPDATVRLLDCALHATASVVTASVMGEVVDYSLGLPGRHWVMNSLAVLAAVRAVGADLAAAAAALATLAPLAGRGQRHTVAIAGGSFALIDESYNASPAAMRAAFAVLGSTEPGADGRRIAVLGDMLELGTESRRLHAALAQPLVEAGIDLIFTLGEEMRALDAALPPAHRGGHADDVAALASMLGRRLRTGDVVTVKGSHGSKLYELVAKLLAAQPASPQPATSGVEA